VAKTVAQGGADGGDDFGDDVELHGWRDLLLVLLVLRCPCFSCGWEDLYQVASEILRVVFVVVADFLERLLWRFVGEVDGVVTRARERLNE